MAMTTIAKPMSDPLPTEIIRELAGHASIGEPVWEVEARDVPVELEPDYLSPAEQAGWQIIETLDPETRAKLLALIDNGEA